MNILQKIFIDNYEEIKYTTHPRHSVMENIDKMIHCGNPSYGGAMYGCSKYGNLKFVPFHCKIRFCTTCGRDLKWNLHIHCLLSEGGLGKSGKS